MSLGDGLHKLSWPDITAVPTYPLDIHQATVKPEWIDYNGHLNMAYYVLMFDNATDNFFDLIDLGVNYVNRSQHSAFVLETHVTYQWEVSLDDRLRFTVQLIDADEKRLITHQGDEYGGARGHGLTSCSGSLNSSAYSAWTHRRGEEINGR